MFVNAGRDRQVAGWVRCPADASLFPTASAFICVHLRFQSLAARFVRTYA